jgi:hypothetical protein
LNSIDLADKECFHEHSSGPEDAAEQAKVCMKYLVAMWVWVLIAGHLRNLITQPIKLFFKYRVDHNVVPLGANKKTFFCDRTIFKNLILN